MKREKHEKRGNAAGKKIKGRRETRRRKTGELEEVNRGQSGRGNKRRRRKQRSSEVRHQEHERRVDMLEPSRGGEDGVELL